MKIRPIPLVLSLAAATLGVGTAWAHHSTAAYDFGRSVTLHGTVRSFQWANPHNFIQVTSSDSGRPVEWSVEAGTPATATRMGWTRSVIKPGDRITLVIAPMRDGSPGGTLRTLTLASGRTLNGVAADPNATKPFNALPSLQRATPPKP